MIMDTKDAHKVIENLQTRPYICSENTIELDNGYVIAKKEYFQELQEARERQIPKKPNKRQVGTNILMSKIYYCPICDKKLYDCAIKKGKLDYVSPGSKKSKFCEDCGQAIDWSETV